MVKEVIGRGGEVNCKLLGDDSLGEEEIEGNEVSGFKLFCCCINSPNRCFLIKIFSKFSL